MKYMNEAGDLHRVNAPSREWKNGDYSWWYNGQRHRYYGPAFYWGGRHEFWIFDEAVR